ncbi:PAS domain-containing sensor histidine kinase [Mucilaginibacter antarcticus]|uniref:histidine kinase n=1 Tax=Mucilaginibacter antarcticus TaxID=1855725 RepID=A0ABW5XQC8_9SPHI
MTQQQNFDTLNVPGNASVIFDLTLNRFTYLAGDIKLFGIKQDATVDSILSAIHKDDIPYLEQQFIALLNNSFNGSLEFRILLNDLYRTLRVTPFVLQSADTKTIIANIIDVTDEVNNRYVIEKFANKKNAILTMLSHDLRGPLSIGKMVAQSLSTATDDVKVKGQSQNLVKILKQALDLVNDLISREETDTITVELVKKRIDIATKLKEYIEEIRLSEDALHRTILYSSSDETIYAHIDEAKFMQIINNLVSNALKFTRDGDIISLTVEEKEDSVQFIFSDTGVGIPEQFHTELFEKFTPARRKGLNGEPSIGIGLSIVKTIVDWHGGIIKVNSEENKGTTFYLELPKG